MPTFPLSRRLCWRPNARFAGKSYSKNPWKDIMLATTLLSRAKNNVKLSVISAIKKSCHIHWNSTCCGSTQTSRHWTAWCKSAGFATSCWSQSTWKPTCKTSINVRVPIWVMKKILKTGIASNQNITWRSNRNNQSMNKIMEWNRINYNTKYNLNCPNQFN